MGKQLILSALLLIGIFSCNTKSQLSKIHDIIHETEKEYAPDSRTAIFKIELKNTTPIIIKGETNLAEAKSSLLSRIRVAEIPIQDSILLLPDKRIGDNKFALINVSVANLRVNPKHSAELATQAILGTPVNVLQYKSGWYLVQTPDKYIAWTNAGSLVLLDEEELKKWKAASKIIYLDTYGFSMNESGTQRISDLVSGNVFVLDHETKLHFVVTYPDGKTAIIAKNEAEILSSWFDQITLSGRSISNISKDLMGIPYLWGGTSTKGLDCSGFTKTVYFLHGLVIPRDASQQVQIGELVDENKDFSQLQVGDLLFFGRKNDNQSEQIIHVGLWLGNNEFIHASGDVHISSMDSLAENFDRYNLERYLRSKRIVGDSAGSIPGIPDIYYQN